MGRINRDAVGNHGRGGETEGDESQRGYMRGLGEQPGGTRRGWKDISLAGGGM